MAPPDFWDDFWDEFIFVEDEPESHSGSDTEPSEIIVLRKKNILLKEKIAVLKARKIWFTGKILTIFCQRTVGLLQ